MQRCQRFFWVIIVAIFCQSCSQLIYVKPRRELRNFSIAKSSPRSIGTDGALLRIPTGIGPVAYHAHDALGNELSGFIAREKLNPWALIGSLAGAAICIPLMGMLGVFTASPRLAAMPLLSGGSGTKSAFFHQNFSTWTIPITAIFALVGSLPLLGLMKSEKVSDEVKILP